ncbi:MAG: hypothetical protein IPJ88_05505 [Myxococcales bacterium]|nr:MAG: hypothetical protein IPJ88_05505 [Myxococcales bacterium]
MIHYYNNEMQTRWDHGEFKVQLIKAGSTTPIGFCDGTPDDLAELRSIAEGEDSFDMQITKKLLKTGREIWTLGEAH